MNIRCPVNRCLFVVGFILISLGLPIGCKKDNNNTDNNSKNAAPERIVDIKDKLDHAIRRINASENHNERFKVASSIARNEEQPSEVRSIAMGVMFGYGIRSVESLVEILVETSDNRTRKTAYSILLTVKRDLSADSKQQMAAILLKKINDANYDAAALIVDLLQSYNAQEALSYLRFLRDRRRLGGPILELVNEAIIEIEGKKVPSKK